MSDWKLFIPTYNRTQLNCLKLLERDSEIELNLCVREEQLADGFYDFLKGAERVNLISLGTGIRDLGETRQRILTHCKENDIDFCVMLDDGLDNIYCKSCEKLSPSDCISAAVEQMKNDKMSKYCAIYQFHRPERKYSNVDASSRYFVGMPLQALIINVKIAKDYDLNYYPICEAGFEDEAFFIDAVKKGLITCSNSEINVSGALPNVPKVGGSHGTSDTKMLVERYDRYNTLFLKHIGPTYGVYITKCMRHSIGAQVSYCLFDYAYFKKVLVDDRDENQEIIDKHFKIDNPWEETR
jgi:hypothetical protein